MLDFQGVYMRYVGLGEENGNYSVIWGLGLPITPNAYSLLGYT